MPVSKTRLRAIGKALVEGMLDAAMEDELGQLLTRADEAQAGAQVLIQRALAGAGEDFQVRGRAKSRITLREKLDRMGARWLPDIRDLAGVRVVGPMTLTDQDEVMRRCCDALAAPTPKLIDRRVDPRAGYRALHAEVTFQGSLLEVQVRTLMQHAWADAYERLADTAGRSIRYSADTSHLSPENRVRVEQMRQLSEAIAQVETARASVAQADAQVAEARAVLDNATAINKISRQRVEDAESRLRFGLQYLRRQWEGPGGESDA